MITSLFMRMFIMKYFNLFPECLDDFMNPRNCETWILEKNSSGNYDLILKSDQLDKDCEPIKIIKVNYNIEKLYII